ncbi:MAG TPA: hypothetical protein VKM55_13755 [Candidatus Lokiarchaeia archaeon]|nr:hypothetical protein [Candidatus Lokiarchaeia archaeon]
MIDGSIKHNPLFLYFTLVKRQPFVLSGFLDSTEFAAFKDFMPHCAIHNSLDKAGMGKLDGTAMLAQLLDSEAEDVVEGQKNAIFIHNATTEDLDLLTSQLDHAWMASTVIPAADVAKKYHVPVYDLKTERWININTDNYDTLWASSMLASHEDDAMGLRMAIKDFYHDATMLAAWMLASDANGKIYGLLQKYENPNTRDALLETVSTYFGINAREVVQGLSGEITIQPPSNDPIEQPVAVPKDVLPPATVTKEAKQDPFMSEYYFLSKNVIFKKALVKAVNDTDLRGTNFTSPAAKYSYLRSEGTWKDSIPHGALKGILETIIAGCEDVDTAKNAAKAFESSAVAFKMADRAAILSIIAETLSHARLPSKQSVKKPIVAGRSWQVPGPPPEKPGPLIAWLNRTITDLQHFTANARQIAKQRGLAGAGFARFTLIPLPKPLAECRGRELVPWLHDQIEGLQGWIADLQPARDTNIVASWKKALAAYDRAEMDSFLISAFPIFEQAIKHMHAEFIGTEPADIRTSIDELYQGGHLQVNLRALHWVWSVRNKKLHEGIDLTNAQVTKIKTAIDIVVDTTRSLPAKIRERTSTKTIKAQTKGKRGVA